MYKATFLVFSSRLHTTALCTSVVLLDTNKHFRQYGSFFEVETLPVLLQSTDYQQLAYFINKGNL